MTPDPSVVNVLGIVVSLTLHLGYYIALEGCCGITIGKRLTKTHAVSASGGKASLGQIVGRSFARIIPFERLSFFGGDKQTGWHDSMPGTIVIEN